MALTGYTYQAIADQLGYASRGTVHRIVTKALKEQQVESVDELRQLELDRLDMLQYAYWDRALDGDHQAALLVLRVMDQRLRLLALPVAWSAAAPEVGEPITTLW